MKIDICMLLDKPADNDSRVLREAQALQDAGWSIIILSYSTKHRHKQMRQVDGIDVLEIPISNMVFNKLQDNLLKLITYILVSFSILLEQTPPRWFLWLFLRTTRLWLTKYRTGIIALQQITPTYIHAHDYLTLPVPFATFQNPNVIYDSHELYFEQYQPPMPRFKRMLTAKKRDLEKHLEKQFAHQCLAVINVSEKNAEYMQASLNLDHVFVVRNLVDAPTVPPAVDYQFKDKIIIVHVGNLQGGRQLDVLIQAFQILPDNFALILMGNGELHDELAQLSTALGLSTRVQFIPAIEPKFVSATLAQADISAVLNPHGGPNREHTYPQKLFESIAAGLPIITTDTISILNLVKQYDFGIIVDPTDPHAVAKAIEKIAKPKTYAYYKEKVLQARETLNWQNEKHRLVRIYENLGKPD